MSWTIPVKTEHMKNQENHVPSMRYAEDIYAVASTLKDIHALEIGGAWGFSTLAILEAGAISLETVDPNTMAECHNEAEASGYTNHTWNVVRSDKYWAENLKVKFGLIYVDGSHLYKDVVNDLYQAWERLEKGGLLMIDDWEHKNNIKADGDASEYGVSLACFEFWKDHVDQVVDVGIHGRVLWFKK